MKLPTAIKPEFEELESICRDWPADVSVDQLVNWILQFDPDDHDLAIRLLRHLNVLGPNDIRSGLQIAYARLKRRAKDRETEISHRNTMFFAVGDAGKSGAMIAYEFRLANELPESNFSAENSSEYLKEGLVKNIVLVDDVIGTGKSAIRAATSIKEEATPLGVENVFILSVCGFDGALTKVSEETGADTFAAYTYGKQDTVSCFDSDFYSGLEHEQKASLLERLKYYNSRCHRSDLGFGNVGALLAFTHNPPNISVPVIWASGNGWNPLFPRLGRITGLEHFYKQAKSAQKELAEKKVSAASQSESKLTILVEGKVDEVVLDLIIERFKFAERLDVDRVSVVSLGGIYSSLRLFEIIQQTGGSFVLLLDDDEQTDRWLDKNSDSVGIPLVKLSPSIVGLLRLETIVSTFEFSTDAAGKLDREGYRDIEMHLRNRGFGRTLGRTGEILDRFIDNQAVESLLQDIKSALKHSPTID